MTHASTIAEATPASIAAAAQLLREGRLVAFPTETVYGLGADATNDTAVAGVFAAKGRPEFNPLIVHVENTEAAMRYGTLDPRALILADAFWPGALTLVVPRTKNCPVSLLATAGLDTIALRVPAHPVARELLAAFGGPVAAPSANRSGTVSPTTADHVAESLGDAVALILDGGPTAHGLESTIIGLTEGTPTLLRPGAIARDEIEEIIGALGAASDSEGAPHSPGRLKRHYATATPLRLDATSVASDEALLAFGPPLDGAARTMNLSPSGDLKEAAANLFAMLRALDAWNMRAIAVMPIPHDGLGEAINDRLRRAAVRA